MAIGDLIVRRGQWMTEAQARCLNGPSAGAGQVLVGHVACSGNGGGGHSIWHCRTCEAVTDGSALAAHCVAQHSRSPVCRCWPPPRAHRPMTTVLPPSTTKTGRSSPVGGNSARTADNVDHVIAEVREGISRRDRDCEPRTQTLCLQGNVCRRSHALCPTSSADHEEDGRTAIGQPERELNG
jgi:hypothetical protein